MFLCVCVCVCVRKQRGRGECCAYCNEEDEEVETIILVDGCKFSDKMAKILPSGSMIVEIHAVGSGMDEHYTSL